MIEENKKQNNKKNIKIKEKQSQTTIYIKENSK